MRIRTKCNLCLNEEGNSPGRITHYRIADCQDIYWVRYFKLTGIHGMDIEHTICGRCGSIFQKQLIEDEELFAMEKISQGGLVPWSAYFEKTCRLMNAKRFGVVERFIRSNTDLDGKRVLDVGGRDGGFGQPLLKYGIDYWIIDVEDYTGRNVEGSTFVHGDFDTYAFNEPFDLIVMNHVLEHVFYPIKSLERAWELLGDDGQIFIDIPVLPLAPGTYHRSEFYVKPLLLEVVRRAGFEIQDIEDVLIGYDNSILASYRVMARKVEKRDVPIRGYVDQAKNVLSDFHHDIVRGLTEAGEPFVIYGLDENVVQPLELGDNFLGFVDDDPAKHGEWRGWPVQSPQSLGASSQNVIILTPNKEETRQRLLRLTRRGVHLIANSRNF